MRHIPTKDIIADYPAYLIYKPYAGRKFKHGEVIAIPYESQSHGTLYTFYTLGTVAGYALRNGEDPIEAVERCKRDMIEKPYAGHKLYWANQNSVCIHNGPYTKEEVPGFNIGDNIILQGRAFQIVRAPNQNINLVKMGEVQ